MVRTTEKHTAVDSSLEDTVATDDTRRFQTAGDIATNDPVTNRKLVSRKRDDAPRLYDLNFALVLVMQFFFVVANTLIAHYARWIEFLGGNVAQVGWIIGVSTVLGMVLRPWMGEWIDRVGPRKSWFLGIIVFALGAFGNLLLTDLHAGIYAFRSCLAVGGAIVFLSTLTYVTHVTPSGRRTEAIGIMGCGGMVGMLVGPGLGDLLLSSASTRDNFVVLFIAAGSGCIIPATLLFFLRPSPGKLGTGKVGLTGFLRNVQRYWPGMIVLVSVVYGACMVLPFVFLASYIDEFSLHLPGLSVIGMFFWCYSGCGVLVRTLLRRVPDQWGRRKMLLLGLSLLCSGQIVFALSAETLIPSNTWLIIAPAMLMGSGHGMIYHTLTSLSIERFPAHARATGSAFCMLLTDCGMLVGAPILGWVAGTFGYQWMVGVLACLILIAAAAYAYSSIPVWQARREDKLSPSAAVKIR